jgi:hypothetical protein
LHRLLMVVMLVASPQVAPAQDSALVQAAERARKAWLGHDASTLVANSPRLLIQLPGADPSVALGPDQAAALLANFLGPAQEVDALVLAAKEVEPGRGYVELQRRYKVAGTQNVRTQILLLSYREGPRGWTLVEFRVVG